MIINESVIKSKINEYLNLLVNNGYITSNELYEKYKKELDSLIVIKISNAPGNAKVRGNVLSICQENIEISMERQGEYILDEVLFHEFSHIINAFHKSSSGKNQFIIRDYLKHKINIGNDLESLHKYDDLLYNQDPYFGVILLDEFIAQYIAQDLITTKYNKLSNDIAKRIYANDELASYRYREITTKMCEPPIRTYTAFNCYQVFYPVARKFICKYGYNVRDFVKKALQENNCKYMIDRVNIKEGLKLYIDLCYLGLIEQRVYLLNGFCDIKDKKDPAYYPQKVNRVMRKVLNWNNI